MKFFFFLLSTLFLTACGSHSSAPRRVDQAITDRILIRGNGSEPESLDPHLATSVSAGNLLINLFEGLIRLDPATLEPGPGMAREWEVSDDGRIYTFHLREALWSDDTPLTASDFKFAFRRLLNPSLGSTYTFMLFDIKNARDIASGEAALESLGVETPDEHTLRITLDHPAPELLSKLAHWTAFPVPEHILEKHGNTDNRGGEWTRVENFVSNGAFTLASHRSEDRIVLEKNLAYWEADSVWLNGAEFHVFSDPGAEERAFRSGGIHLTYSLPRHRLRHYQTNHPELLRVDPYLESVAYVFNTKHPVVSDKRVRQALSLAVNRRQITEHLLHDVRKPAFHYVPHGIPGYSSKPVISENAEKARDLLADAGFPNGEGFPTLRLIFPSGQDSQRVAEAIQQQWQTELGVRIQLENLERQTYFSRRRERDFELCFLGWVGDFVDPVTFLGLWQTDSGNNLSGWSDPDYDRMLSDAQNAADSRMEELSRAEAYLLNSLPVMPLYFGATQYLLDPRVQGWEPNVLDWHPLRAVRFETP